MYPECESAHGTVPLPTVGAGAVGIGAILTLRACDIDVKAAKSITEIRVEYFIFYFFCFCVLFLNQVAKFVGRFLPNDFSVTTIFHPCRFLITKRE